jgi:23S rRNA A1618 N6-methylase RlmF
MKQIIICANPNKYGENEERNCDKYKKKQICETYLGNPSAFAKINKNLSNVDSDVTKQKNWTNCNNVKASSIKHMA